MKNLLEISDIHHWELQLNSNIIHNINMDADVNICSFGESFSCFDYQVYGVRFRTDGTVSFPRQNNPSLKISIPPTNVSLA